MSPKFLSVYSSPGSPLSPLAQNRDYECRLLCPAFFFSQWVLWSNSGSHSNRDNTLLTETIPEPQTFLNLLKLSGLLKFTLSNNNEDKKLKLSWKLQNVYKRIIFLWFARLRELGVTRLECFISNVLNFCQNSRGKWSEGVSKLGCLFGATSHPSVLVPLPE